MKRNFTIGFLISAILCLVFCIYCITRSSYVFNFRTQVSMTCSIYNTSDIKDKKIVNAWLIYNKLPTFNQMVYSFKPLTLETYVDKKIVNELNRPYENNLNNLK